MTKYFNTFALALWIMSSLLACTTTTKTVSTGITVESASQLEQAKKAFRQRNYSLAADLLKPLANQGEDYAQYALGYMYYNGMGVPRSTDNAIIWLKQSAAKGNKNAIEAMRILFPVSTTPAEGKPRNESKPGLETSPTVVDRPLAEAVEPSKQVNQEDSPVMTGMPGASSDMVEEEAALVTETASVTQEMGQEAVPLEKPAQDSEKMSALTESEQWLVSQPDTHYTIQLLVSGNEAAMQKFIVDNNLQDDAIYYRSLNKGKDLLILVKGSYESFSLASKALSRLPNKLKKKKPWIRSIGTIKEKLLSR